MNDPILDYIAQFVTLTREEEAFVKQQNLIKSFKKNDVLLREGELATECYFIVSGCVRACYLKDGEERNTDFYFENQNVIPVTYKTNQPSPYYLICLEDSVIALGSEERNKKLLEHIPKLNKLVTELSQAMYQQKVQEFDQFKNESPEQRYLNLLQNKPAYMDRIPLYHLASYLGITQVSLSRIRSRITK